VDQACRGTRWSARGILSSTRWCSFSHVYVSYRYMALEGHSPVRPYARTPVPDFGKGPRMGQHIERCLFPLRHRTHRGVGHRNAGTADCPTAPSCPSSSSSPRRSSPVHEGPIQEACAAGSIWSRGALFPCLSPIWRPKARAEAIPKWVSRMWPTFMARRHANGMRPTSHPGYRHRDRALSSIGGDAARSRLVAMDGRAILIAAASEFTARRP